MIHTSITKKCTVFILRRELTRSATYPLYWPTKFVGEVKGKPRNFEWYLCGSLYSTFKISVYSYSCYNKQLQTLFKDQLDRSKATCSFNIHLFLLEHLNGWCSLDTDSYPWIQVNLNARVYIAGLIIHRQTNYNVETYRVKHGYYSSSLTFATTSSGSTQLVSTVKSLITPITNM